MFEWQLPFLFECNIVMEYVLITFWTRSTKGPVSRALPKHGFVVQSAQLGYRPKNPVTLGDAERAEVEAFLEAVDADDDVQKVFPGLAG